MEHVHTLSNEVPSLDLSTPLWRLAEGQASEVLGVDVYKPNQFRPDRGRRPIGVSLPEEDRPVTSVDEINADAFINVRKTFLLNAHLSPTGERRVFPWKGATDGGVYNSSTGGLNCPNLTFEPDYGFREGDQLHILTNIAGTVDLVNPPKMIPILGTAGDLDILQLPLGVLEHNGRYSFLMVQEFGYGSNWLPITVDGVVYNVVLKGHRTWLEEGPWDDAIIGTPVLFNEDRRGGARKVAVVRRLWSVGHEKDAFLVDSRVIHSDVLSGNPKVTLSYKKSVSWNGLLVSNGRKFWLLQDGVYTLLMDLQDDSFKGVVWQTTRIARNRFLLTSPNYAPRILHLGRTSPLAGDGSLAGAPPLEKPQEILEEANADDVSWLMEAEDSGGAVTDTGDGGTGIRIDVRGVNLEDNLVSAFTPAIKADARSVTTDETTVSGLGSLYHATAGATADESVVSLYHPQGQEDGDTPDSEDRAGFVPPISSRYTYIEVWRTGADGATAHHLETRIGIADPVFNEQEDTTFWFLVKPTPSTFPVSLSNDALVGLPVATTSERESHGLPPFCRQAVSIRGGITLCFGKADDDVTLPVVNARGFAFLAGIWTAATNTLSVTTPSPDIGSLSLYSFQSGDKLVVVEGGYDSSSKARFPLGTYDILSGGAGSLVLTSPPLGVDVSASIQGYVLRPYVLNQPSIEDDETVWYSRTDAFNPESFPLRFKTLSRIGDVFRKAIAFDQYAVVVMDQGVHVLYLSGVGLQIETIEQVGAGTPWADSVIAVGDKVLWASKYGIKMLTLTPSTSDGGVRGTITFLDGQQNNAWFEEALKLGQNIDAGVDPTNNVVRFRRATSDHTSETLVGSLNTRKTTLIHEDNGVGYGWAYRAEENPTTLPRLYSVDRHTGAVFDTHNTAGNPYPDCLLQVVLDKDIHVATPTSIDRGTDLPFSSLMVGEPIRFRHTDGTETVRTILTASTQKITFDTAFDLAYGDEFLIAPTRFRLRFAAAQGTRPTHPKTLKGLTLMALPGERGDRPDLTVRAYENFSKTPVPEDTVPTFSEDDPGRTSVDRVSSVSAEGTAVEIEIENLETRNDFDLRFLEAVIEEEGLQAADTET